MMDSLRSGGRSDEDLVHAVQADPTGEAGRAASAELYRRYQSQVYLWCFRRVRDHERALDLAQDVLLSAHRALGTFAGRARYSSWLFTIMRNRCFRDHRTRRPWSGEAIDPAELPGGERSPEEVFLEQENEEAILELMRTALDPTEQLALWLRCFDEMPVEEITSRLGISGASGARAVLQSARRKLRSAIARRNAAERRPRA
jgi:RNA polymerase sigma-70 factor, ECF subfamily